MSYWADSAFIAAAGIPTVLYGPGGEGAHAAEEWVSLADTEIVARVLHERRGALLRGLMAARNLVNLKDVGKGYGAPVGPARTSRSASPRATASASSARNGSGKSTLLRLIAGVEEPDAGQSRAPATLDLALLGQGDELDAARTIRDELVGGRADHEWAADAGVPRRARRAARRRRAQPLPAGPRHADRAAVGRRAPAHRARAAPARQPRAAAARRADEPPRRRGRRLARAAPRGAPRVARGHHPRPLVPRRGRAPRRGRSPTATSTSTRAATRRTCSRAPSASARPPRARTRRQQLLRKELAWLRRGPPARTSKPKFRIEAANALIADEPDAARHGRAAALRGRAAGRQGARARSTSRVAFGEQVLLRARDLAARARATASRSSASTARARRR